MVFNKQLIVLLRRLRTAHRFYVRSDEKEKDRLLNALDYTFELLAEYGAPNSFCLLFVIYGDDFTQYEFGGKTMDQYIDALKLGGLYEE